MARSPQKSTPPPPLHAANLEERIRNLTRSRNRIAKLTKKKAKCNKQTRKLRGERNKFLTNVNNMLSEFDELIGSGGQIYV